MPRDSSSSSAPWTRVSIESTAGVPRVAGSGPRPSQIIISLSDKKTAFGAYDPEVVQLFEAFRLPPDRDSCEWEPW